jgi:hypothetical protein
VIENTSVPVAIVPLNYDGMQRDGSNQFTYSRFLVPELCNFSGFAIYAEADMLALADLTELWDLRDRNYAVQVVKHDYSTRHQRKYVGTEMEALNESYPRKNWSSLAIWNCGHIAHFEARDKLRAESGKYLHRFSWLKDQEIGDLPKEWNWLADESGVNTKAKLLHWTAGIPSIEAHRDAPHSAEWHNISARSMQSPQEARIAEIASER